LRKTAAASSSATMDIFDPFYPTRPTFEDTYRKMARSESRLESLVGRMILDLLNALRSGIAGPRLVFVGPLEDHNVLWFNHSDENGNETLITLGVDWKDYSSFVDGVPQAHYRLTYTRHESPGMQGGPKAEIRTDDVQTAYRFVLEAIGQSSRDS
jgi:hypothetical protein